MGATPALSRAEAVALDVGSGFAGGRPMTMAGRTRYSPNATHMPPDQGGFRRAIAFSASELAKAMGALGNGPEVLDRVDAKGARHPLAA